MKAALVEKYGGPESLVLRDVETPAVGPGEILVEVHAAGVNPVDTYMRSGMQGYGPKLPWTPGIDAAGVVVEVGDGVDNASAGDSVYVVDSLSGTYAEYCLCRSSQVFPLPGALDWLEGASLGVPYFTAARAMFSRGRIESGESMLVHGATGGVGQACLQLAADRDIRVFGSAGSAEGRKIVEANGADCVDHRDPNHFGAIRESLGSGVDLIVEMLADVNLDEDLKILADHGRVVVVGSRGRIEIAPRDLMSTEASISGVKMAFSTSEERTEYARLIEEGAAAGRIKPLIAEVFDMKSAGEAHRRVIEGPHTGNFVIGIK